MFLRCIPQKCDNYEVRLFRRNKFLAAICQCKRRIDKHLDLRVLPDRSLLDFTNLSACPGLPYIDAPSAGWHTIPPLE